MPQFRQTKLALVADRQHYTDVVSTLAEAKVSVWIGTANVKDLMVEAPIGSVARARKKYISMVDVLRTLVGRGVDVRLLHAGTPSRAFQSSLGRVKKGARPSMKQCPRVHFKVIIVDGARLYLGSANFTGAGLGAKADARRNFELGVVTDDDVFLDAVQARFDRIWSGAECKGCRLRSVCPKPLDS